MDNSRIIKVEGVYHSLFELNQSAILLIDPATLAIVDANPAAYSFCGYKKAELLAKKLTEIVVQPETRHLTRAGRQQRFKVQHRLANGQIRQVEAYTSPIEWHGRQLLGYTILDATGCNRTEVELHRRNRELTLLNQVIAASVTSSELEEFLASTCRELAQAFDLTQAVALLLSDDKRRATVVAGYNANSSAPAPNGIYPIGPDSLLHTVFSLASPLIVADVHNEARLAHLKTLFQQGGISSLLLLPLLVERRVIGLLALMATEAAHFAESHLSLSWTVADQIAGALTRIQLQKQRTQLSTVIEQMVESVVITDAEDAVIYVNPAFERVTGYSRADIIGQTPGILKSGKQSAEFYRALWQTISNGQVWRGRLVNRKKDGSLFTEEATITPIRDEQGAIVNYVAVKRDVTRELELEEQYRQVQKMEAIGSLAGGIAHDFNNLLTGINGFAELLQMQLPPDSPHQEPVTRIIEGGQRAAELVRQLLAFSRKQVIEPRILNLNSLISDLEKLLRRLISEHIELVTCLNPYLWPIKADPTQLEQIILNLAINGRDAMVDGGQLRIETGNVTLTDEDVAGHLEMQPGKYVVLSVADTGIGMSAEVKTRIFEPFFTTKELGRGTGLGLATVYGIVKQSGGFICVYSEVGQGTNFRIHLPRANDYATFRARPTRSRAMPRGSETILLVEDELQVRELASSMLRRQGYQVFEATDGAEALTLAQKYANSINLLVTDVILPKLNGPNLAANLKATQPDLKILYLSGYADEMIARHGVLEPGVPLLTKPFSATLLAQKVRQVLETNNNNHIDDTT